MKIDDEIKSKFSSEVQRATVNILFSYNWLTSMHAEVLKPFGISIQQYNVLRILRGQHPQPASIKLIAERMIDKNSNASRLVDKLLQKNLVKRQHCKHDRRQVDVAITNKGLELLEEVSELTQQLSKRIKLTEKEASQLSSLLDKMRG